MSTRRGITTGLVLAAVLAGPGLAADDPATYLTENEGRKVLKEPLTVREGQVGIAGLTGTVWTVEPSGEWKYSRFRRNRDGSEHLTPIRSGTLSAAELEDLAKSLARQEFSTLPEGGPRGEGQSAQRHDQVWQEGGDPGRTPPAAGGLGRRARPQVGAPRMRWPIQGSGIGSRTSLKPWSPGAGRREAP